MRREGVFAGLAIATLVLLFLSSPLALLWLGWFLDPGSDQISHRVHEVAFGCLFAVVFVGVVAQLRHPDRNIAGMQQAVVAVVVLAAVAVLAGGSADPLLLLYLVPVLGLVALHPARRQLLLPPLAPSGWMIVVGLTAVPALLAMAFDELDLASRQVGGHVEHWGAMAAFAFTVIGLIVIAALRPPGGRVSAWSAGGAMAIYAATSVAYPDDASSAVLRTEPWIVLSLAWSALFVAVAERSRTDRRVPETDRPPRGRAAAVGRASGRVVLVGGAVFGLLVMALVWSVTATPRIPHQVSDTSRANCASCHFDGVNATTGEANVPAIDPSGHPLDTPPGTCVSCHAEGGFLEVEGAMVTQVQEPVPAAPAFGRPAAAQIAALRAYEAQRVAP